MTNIRPNPLVSVIVPTKNSEEFLNECLHSIYKQTYKNIEIIVVDNHSTDNTERIALMYTQNFYIFGNERAEQINYGVLKSNGQIIYVTGSDMTRDETFIEEGVHRIWLGCDAIYMSVLTDSRVKHFWGKVKTLERQTYIENNLIESTRFFKKYLWTILGGFDEELVQIEEDFQHRLDKRKYITGRIMAREYHLHEEDSLAQIFKKSAYYGSFMKHYLKKHKERGISQLSPSRPLSIKQWKLFAEHPLLTFGFMIYKIVQYLGGIWGMIR